MRWTSRGFGCGLRWWRASAEKPKQIIKEGLSEYFIYTIEGTETIPNGWSKRMRSFEGQTVPFKIQYRYRPAEYGDQLVRMYLLTNDKESKLGTTPLPDGMVRVFRQNGRDGLSLPGGPADQVRPHRRQDRVEPRPGPGGDLRAGQAPDLAGQHLDADSTAPTSFRRVDEPGVQIEVNSTRGRLGRPHALRPADSQLHEEADRGGDPPDLPRPRRLPQRVWRPRATTTRRSSTRRR